MGSDPGTPTDIEIVGVVGNARYESLRDEIPLTVYLCNEQIPGGGGGQVVYVRTERDPANAFATIRAAVREIEPNLPIPSMITLDRQLDESLVTERMIATLSSVFGVLATVLAIVGLYGVMAVLARIASSSAASAEIRTKMPVTSGHADVVAYCAARRSRIMPTVITSPCGMPRITASTSRGLGISSVPAPSRFCIFGGMSTTLGRFGLSIFSRQVLRVRMSYS